MTIEKLDLRPPVRLHLDYVDQFSIQDIVLASRGELTTLEPGGHDVTPKNYPSNISDYRVEVEKGGDEATYKVIRLSQDSDGQGESVKTTRIPQETYLVAICHDASPEESREVDVYTLIYHHESVFGT